MCVCEWICCLLKVPFCIRNYNSEWIQFIILKVVIEICHLMFALCVSIDSHLQYEEGTFPLCHSKRSWVRTVWWSSFEWTEEPVLYTAIYWPSFPLVSRAIKGSLHKWDVYRMTVSSGVWCCGDSCRLIQQYQDVVHWHFLLIAFSPKGMHAPHPFTCTLCLISGLITSVCV